MKLSSRVSAVVVLLVSSLFIAVPQANADNELFNCSIQQPHPEFYNDIYSSDSEEGNIASTTWRLYMATFLRQPDREGFDYWVQQLENSGSVNSMAWVFTSFDEFNLTYGDISDGEFVRLVYNNVLCREPDQDGFEYWLDQLQSGNLKRHELMLYFSESLEYLKRTNTCWSYTETLGLTEINSQVERCRSFNSCPGMIAAGYFDISNKDILYTNKLDANRNLRACDGFWNYLSAYNLDINDITSIDRTYADSKVVHSIAQYGDKYTGTYAILFRDGSTELVEASTKYWIFVPNYSDEE